MKILDKENFDEEISKGITLVDFYADWCGPCKMMGVVLESIDDQVRILKVNVDNHEDLARRFSVMSIPTIIFFKDGEMVKKEIGFQDQDTILNILKEI